MCSPITSAAMTGITMTFRLLDQRFHAFSHGWRGTAREVLKCNEQAINYPKKAVEFSRYKFESESNAEPDSLQPRLYDILVGASVLSFFLFWIV